MPDPQHIDAADDPRLPALMAWRQRLIEAGAVSRTSFKEAHLRLVLRSGRTDVAQIRAMLPPSAAEHADEMARLLADLENRRGSVEVVTDDAPSTDAIAEQIPYQTGDFAAFQLGEQRGDVHPIGLRRRRDQAQSGALELTWPPYLPAGDDTVVIYRIVSDEDDPPYSPDRAYLLGVTTATSALDDRPPHGAVRHYQVWVNSGRTRAQALAAQPVKHAEAALVSPVRDFTIREDGGQVIGRWTVPSAVSDVFVYRIPAQEAGREGLEHRILRGSDTRHGFVDTEALRGERYLYRVRCAVTIGGVIRLSEATEATVDVSAVLAPVTDLSLGAHSQDGSRFELTWTPPPTGTVVIYRSQTPPSAGAEAVELPEATLEQIGLPPVQRLTQPVSLRRDEHGHNRAVMSGVSWPDSWSRAYFTPVTVLTGRALLGTTVSSVRTGVIHDVNLAEYCNKQVLTFDWPAGAAAVVAHLAPKGYDPRKGLTGKSFEISVEEYEKYGGMQLSRQELPAAGCSLHLAPVAFSAGHRVVGAIRSVEYAGLLRLQYAVRIARDPDGWPGYATVALRSQYELPGSPAFVLIHNPQRIPLSMHDGQAVDAAPVNEHGQIVGEPSKELRWSALTTHGTGEMWTANVHGLHGWIRLFVSTPSPARLRTIALLDPLVENLRLSAVAP